MKTPNTAPTAYQAPRLKNLSGHWMALFTVTMGYALATQSLHAQEFSASPAPAAPAVSDFAEPNDGEFESSRFRTSLDVRHGYDDNVYTDPRGEEVGSMFTGINLGVNRNLGGERTQVDIGIDVGGDYYWDVPEDDFFWRIRGQLGITHRMSPRLTVGLASSLIYESEPDFEESFSRNSRLGNYIFSRNRIFASYRWSPRFSTITSYSLNAIFYEDGNVASSSDRLEHFFGQELRYLYSPTTTLVGEYRFGIVSYDGSSSRDSTSHYLLGGIDHQLNPRSLLTLRAGAEFRDFDNGGDETSPYVEANLRYAYGERSSISLISRYGFEQSEFDQLQERTTLRTGVRLTHGFTPRTNLNVSAFYVWDDYDRGNQAFDVETGQQLSVGSFSEELLSISVGLDYALNRTFTVSANYTYSEVFSDVAFREYDRSRYWLGLRATF
ncbi:MAG: outer membrane beta-barrel protein [Verrucomicrobiales bacterium]